ncbi:hypothetical protein KTD13_04935 [Burkholderia multivorans]|uniref:hypothetical protein n=1 Tax=Burkholderia TaxID=32008 RepID=UPI001C23A543|nr:hypothetical protein [Burkholderia multivorans]MBU9259698.1 hypothetical protein [Burkholderia multivorans]MBU9544790.1 hypothetical protein [Burkholderia multivorans]MCA8174572.1 hypothetical protein [Burkholderia multivorans]MCA8222847.1 hypothetical protein [Burkholderia multivorans]
MNRSAKVLAFPLRPGRYDALRQVAADVGSQVRGQVAPLMPDRPRAVPLRSALPQSLEMLHIVSGTVRATAIAPTDRAALDVTGDALRRLAELARTEVFHG